MSEVVDYDYEEDDSAEQERPPRKHRQPGRGSRRKPGRRHEGGFNEVGWEPGPDVVTHAGTEIPEELDFFAAPPVALGEVVTAWSTLKQGQSGLSSAACVGVSCLIAVVVGFGLYFTTVFAGAQGDAGLLLAFLILGSLAGVIAYFLLGFKHICTYVGKQGIARITIKGSREQRPKREVLLFRSADTLTASQTRNYYNGIYTGTTYDFLWKDVDGQVLFRLNGQYRSKQGKPKPKDKFHFARAAESSWNLSLIDRMQSELDEHGSVEFPVNKRDAVRVGPGFLEFDFKGV